MRLAGNPIVHDRIDGKRLAVTFECATDAGRPLVVERSFGIEELGAAYPYLRRGLVTDALQDGVGAFIDGAHPDFDKAMTAIEDHTMSPSFDSLVRSFRGPKTVDDERMTFLNGDGGNRGRC